MTPFLIKNSVDVFYSPTLFIIEPKGIEKDIFFLAFKNKLVLLYNAR